MQAFSPVIFVLVTLLCIFLAHRMALQKGLNPVLWGVLGGIFGPLALLVLVFIKPNKNHAGSD